MTNRQYIDAEYVKTLNCQYIVDENMTLSPVYS